MSDTPLKPMTSEEFKALNYISMPGERSIERIALALKEREQPIVQFEWDQRCQYGAPDWVIIKANGLAVAKVKWVNGPPYLSATPLLKGADDATPR